jgi:D-serine deaminase-like pyridoxal phosphate-dependent protein
METLRPGDLLCVIPAHSCLSVDLLDDAVDTLGNNIEIGRF